MSFTNQFVKMSDKQNTGAGGNPPVLNSDIASLIQDAAAANKQESIPWDNKQWRDELKIAQSKLLHKKFNPAAYRDPMNKPLVANPHGLTAELEKRLRKCYNDAMARNY